MRRRVPTDANGDTDSGDANDIKHQHAAATKQKQAADAAMEHARKEAEKADRKLAQLEGLLAIDSSSTGQQTSQSTARNVAAITSLIIPVSLPGQECSPLLAALIDIWQYLCTHRAVPG